jgi:TonB-dependent receptor
MVNLAYKPLEEQEFGFTFFYNQNATDDARIQDQGKEPNSSSGTYRKFNLYWTERNLTTYQMKGDHGFPDAGGLRFNWLYAITSTSQDEPNARFFNDVNTGSGFTTESSSIPSPNRPTRYFRTLQEDNKNLKLDWTLPFRQWSDDEGQFKFGLFDSRSTRGFTERQFYYDGGGGYNSDPNSYFIANQPGLSSITTNILGGRPRSLRFNWGEFVQVFDSLYSGERGIQAGYLMLDLPTVQKVRLVGGVRYETTDLSVHSESYLDSSITGKRTNDTKLVQSDLLPAVGLIYPIGSNMNVRLNYSQTIARPSFRELAAYYSYDPLISDFVEGNPLLKMTSIANYDARWEWFPHPGELVSVSVFYKDLKDAIERGNIKVEGDTITFLNNDAKLYGVEFEGRKSLDFLGPQFNLFSLGGNFSLLKSEVTLSDSDYANKSGLVPGASRTRPLYDQSPYILNLDFNYNNPASGTAAALIFNLSGPRIAITKLNTDDVYDRPAGVLDFVISQKISRNTTLRFSAKNLLNPQLERTYGKDSDLIYSSYTRGRTFGLTLTREF